MWQQRLVATCQFVVFSVRDMTDKKTFHFLFSKESSELRYNESLDVLKALVLLSGGLWLKYELS